MLKGKKILVGITGGIAVYKVASLVSALKKAGAEVRVIMTDAATKFVAPLTFESLTNSPVYLDLFESTDKSKIEHIALADWCNVAVIVPATYNTLNKIACGLADNLLTTVIAALPEKTPVLFAPAMNCHMWENPILQHGIERLKKVRMPNKKLKYSFIGPGKGQLACGYDGEGILIDTSSILKSIDVLV